jgi:outer membrane protein OmpA-like peptidoglycan-associated protein
VTGLPITIAPRADGDNHDNPAENLAQSACADRLGGRSGSIIGGAAGACRGPYSQANPGTPDRAENPQPDRGQTRSLSLDDREQMAAIATKRPKVDLEINFDYNSAAVTPKAEPQLNSLGKALTAKDLAGSVIMLGGHTDAKGSDDYNQGLSERRAETVKRFLIDNYKIPAANLVTAGYGKKGPKNPNDLYAAENRRVEIVNMAEREEASK